jgi:hypothetical protein
LRLEKEMHFKGAARALPKTPGLVEQAMRQRDIDLELAVAALRDATEDASAAVHSVMHQVRRKATLKPRRRKGPGARTGASAARPLTVAQQLHQIAYQLRLLESSVLRPPVR